MANGDDAVAAGMDKLLGTADRRLGYDEINKTRDYIAQKTSAVLPITKGGTGQTTASAARTALGLPEIGQGDFAQANRIPVYNGTSQLTTADPVLNGHAASAGWVQAFTFSKAVIQAALDTKVAQGQDVTFGQIYTPNSFAASSNWSNAYINGDGRVCRGASSLRYKKYVSAWDPQDLGDVFPTFHRFQMRADGNIPAEGKWRYGYIAERMAENPDTEPFVNYREIDGEVLPDSVNQEGLAIVQISQLHQRALDAEAKVDALIARIEALEAKA